VNADAGDIGAALRACQSEASAAPWILEFEKYWFGDAVEADSTGDNSRVDGNSAGIVGAVQGSGEPGAGGTGTGCS
jgi:hypothetical protein